jgi:hypothetical protein
MPSPVSACARPSALTRTADPPQPDISRRCDGRHSVDTEFTAVPVQGAIAFADGGAPRCITHRAAAAAPRLAAKSIWFPDRLYEMTTRQRPLPDPLP